MGWSPWHVRQATRPVDRWNLQSSSALEVFPVKLNPKSISTHEYTRTIAKLALEDGTVFTGTSFGAAGEVDGEVCFNTSMTGYQEILTDPSYRGQIVTMTYPEIGNYGVNAEDVESGRPQLAGFVVRSSAGAPATFARTADCTIIWPRPASWAWPESTPGPWCGAFAVAGR